MSGVVVCVDPRAADEGATILEAGGNAFDAAITTAFVQMVLMPFMCGVGGMATAHVWKRSTAQHFVVDGLLRAGSLVKNDMWESDYVGEADLSGASLTKHHLNDVGYTSICVPGAVAALDEVHRHVGSLPWAELLKPAADVARTGFLFQPVTGDGAPMAQGEADDATRVRTTLECARLYYREATDVPPDGVVVKNPDYADTIERLAGYGARDMYDGELAEAIAADLARIHRRTPMGGVRKAEGG